MSPVLTTVLVVIAVLAVGAGAFMAVRARLRDADIFAWRTMFGRALVFTVEGEDGEPVRVLSVGGVYQSATYLDERYVEPVFTYYRLFDRMFEADLPVRRILMLGGGGYAYPKHLIATAPDAHVDVVEIDPAITQIAQRYFYLDRLIEEYETEQTGRLGLVTADGRAYLDDLAGVLAAGDAAKGDLAGLRERYGEGFGTRYDAVVNDSFGGTEPAPSLITVEAARRVRSCLVAGGLYVTNVVAAFEGDGARFMRAYVATLYQVFRHVHVIPCGQDALTDRDNNIVIATDGDYRFTGARTVEVGLEDPVLTDAHHPVKALMR